MTASVEIAAPVSETWAVLKDLTAMREYMPGLKSVTITSQQTEGVGASRHCVFQDGVQLTERVVEWREGYGYRLETTAFEGVPLRSNEISFSLTASGSSTLVQQSMRYRMKGGLLGPALEWMARGMMRKALRGALDGLKRRVEG